MTLSLASIFTADFIQKVVVGSITFCFGVICKLIYDKYKTKEDNQDSEIVEIKSLINEKILSVVQATNMRFDDISKDIDKHTDAIYNIEKKTTENTVNIEWLKKNGRE